MKFKKIAKFLKATFKVLGKIQRKKRAVLKVMEGAKVPMTSKQIAYAIPFKINQDALSFLVYKLYRKEILTRAWSAENDAYKYSLSPRYKSKTQRIIDFIDGE